MSDSLRILHLIDSFNQGGSERQALDQVRRLHESGKYQIFLASLSPDGVLRAETEKLNLGEIPSYPLKSFYDPNAARQLRRFAGHLRKLKIDLLHTHDFYTNIFGMAAGFLAGVGVRIASRRETGGMRTAPQTQLQKISYSLAHQIVANSESVRQKLIDEGISAKRITVIHSGLDAQRVAAPVAVSREETLSALGLGQLPSVPKHVVTIVANMRHEVKDYPMFLRAARRVTKTIPDAVFLLAGEGELQESLKQLAVDLGIGEKTIFLGRSESIAQLLSISDVCVLSSKAEGFSNSILEYMAAGRAVVATDVGGAREAIVENETGYLVPSGDDELMAERIISLLLDPVRAQLMGEQGRRVVERNFSSQAMLHKTEALYERLFDEGRRVELPKHQERGKEYQERGQARGAQRGSPAGVEAHLPDPELVDISQVGKAGLPPLF